MFGKNEKPQEIYQIRRDRDTLEPVLCPACRKEMLKVYIPEVGFNIDICVDGCGGIFFDNRELEQLKAPDKDVSEVLSLIKDKEFPVMNQELVRRCGCCNAKMLKMGVSKAKVKIDVCPVCNSKFLDNGELETIRESYIGLYEKSLIEYALKNPESFSIVCSEVISKTI